MTLRGYTGHIPRRNEVCGMSQTQISYRSFSSDFFGGSGDKRPYLFSTTGYSLFSLCHYQKITIPPRFNASIMPKADPTLIATCPKYGQSTIQPLHPELTPEKALTTARESWTSPKDLPRPTWRKLTSGKEVDFVSPVIKDSNQSGFARNTKASTGFVAGLEKAIQLSKTTEYREKFVPQPFHHTLIPISGWTLRRSMKN